MNRYDRDNHYAHTRPAPHNESKKEDRPKKEDSIIEAIYEKYVSALASGNFKEVLEAYEKIENSHKKLPSYTKIRQIYETLKEINPKNETTKEKFLEKLVKKIPRIMYMLRNSPNEKKLGNEIKNILKKVVENENPKDAFEKFFSFFEALVAIKRFKEKS